MNRRRIGSLAGKATNKIASKSLKVATLGSVDVDIAETTKSGVKGAAKGTAKAGKASSSAAKATAKATGDAANAVGSTGTGGDVVQLAGLAGKGVAKVAGGTVRVATLGKVK